MFYIKKDNRIVMYDNSKSNLIASTEIALDYKGLPIFETKENETIIEIVEDGRQVSIELVTLDEAKKIDEQKEAERIAQLHLTGADVERALIKALDIDFEDILIMVKEKQPDQFKMVRAELKANYFYRGNPYVNLLGQMIGLSPEQLDEFFETNDYHALIPPEQINNVSSSTKE